MANVPVSTPAGIKLVPEEKLDFYVSQGAKPVVKMLDDTGKPKWVPRDMVDTAVHKLGGSFPAPAGTPTIKQFVPPGLQGAPADTTDFATKAINSGVVNPMAAGLANGIVGGVKGALHTGYGIASLGSQLLGQGPVAEPDSLQPANLPQKVGFYGEQGAEFMLPESKIKGLSELGKDSRLARILLKGAGTTAFAAGIQATHDADHPKQAALSGASGALVGLGIEGSANMMKDAAGSMFNWAMRIPARGLLGGKNPGVRAMEEGGFGFMPSMKRFATESSARAKQAYNDTEALINSAGGTVDLSGPRFAAHDALYDAMSQGPMADARVGQLQTLADQFEPANYGATNIQKMPIRDALNLRRGLGGAMYHQPGILFEKPVNQLSRGLYGEVGGILDDAVPGLSNLDSRYADYAAMKNAAIARLPIMKQARPFFPIVSTIGGGNVGEIMGRPGLGAAIGALGSKFTVNPAYSYMLGRGAAAMANPFLNRFIGGMAAGMIDKAANNSDTQMLPVAQ